MAVLALGPRARLPADSESLEADQAHELAGRADEALLGERKNKDKDDLKAKAKAGRTKSPADVITAIKPVPETAPAGLNNSRNVTPNCRSTGRLVKG